MKRTSEGLLNYLGKYVTDHKKELVEKVLAERTRHLTLVLEDIYQPQNASAVVRTCEGYGLQDLHVIEGRHEYEPNPRVVRGATKWIDIHKYSGPGNNTVSCFEQLREKGFRILVTSPDPGCLSVSEVDVKEKIALVFGTEKHGISEYARRNADGAVTIPMKGFTESYNLSVSAAICTSILMQKIYDSDINWRLNEEEKQRLKLDWYRKIVHRSEILEKEFLKSVD